MVKNTIGGSKHKGFARKDQKGNNDNKLRLSECEEERYGIVKKIYGGDICEVYCDDDVIRHGIIRGKFRGRSKRNNTITSSTIVLVGLRTWESSTKIHKCDIIEIYSPLETEQLKTHPKFPIHFLQYTMCDLFGTSSTDHSIDSFTFSTHNNNDNNNDNIIDNIIDNNNDNIIDNNNDYNIDINDI
jgi:initiation factor 1A